MSGASTLNKKHVCICKAESLWEFSVWLRELKLGLYDNLEKWDGVRWEGCARGKGHIYNYG